MKKRTFWTGALWGAAIAYIADDLVRRGLRRRRRLSVVGGRGNNVVSLDENREPAEGAELQPQWSPTRPVFQRRTNSIAAAASQAPDSSAVPPKTGADGDREAGSTN